MVSNHRVFRTHRHLLTVASLLAALAGARDVRAQAATGLDHGRLTIAVHDRSWALSLAFEEVSRFCGCVISYEEPEWTWRGDLDTVPGADGQSVAVPRRTTLRLTAAVSDPLTPDDTRRVVTQVIAQFERQTSARFQVRDRWPLEVVPTEVKAADGTVHRPRPLMDTPISVSGLPARPAVWLARIAASLGAATGHDVRPLLRGNQTNIGREMDFDVRNEPVSVAFRRLYAAARPEVGWAISPVPLLGYVTLALRTPRARHLPAAAPAVPGGRRER